MKKFFFIFVILFICSSLFLDVQAQCAMCTKTAQQLGEKPALGLNKAILYLMGAPFAIVGFIGFRWWKQNKKFEEGEEQKA
ncbi:MAG: hypothetical protein JST81_06595 [Bacteroidetes bacterium]|jgi:hypothetical protein|nr:hypothetical protein [Bacteroidota bacterium]